MESTSPGVAQAAFAAVLFIGMLALYLLRFARSWRWVAVTLFVVILDQAAKALVRPGIEHERISFMGGWLRITYAENWEQGFGGNVTYIFALTAICVLALYVLYERLFRARYRMSSIAELAVALMVGGYLGILLDRVRLGFVIDFLEVGPASTFVYNIADLAVFLALALLVARGVQFIRHRWQSSFRKPQEAIGWPKTQ